MSGRLILIIILALAALSSGWLMDRITGTPSSVMSNTAQDPDYYMEDFSTITIGEDGLPLNTLFASYMEHNPADDTLYLQNPKLEIFRTNNDPLYITAEKDAQLMTMTKYSCKAKFVCGKKTMMESLRLALIPGM